MYDFEYKGRESTASSIAGAVQVSHNGAADLIQRMQDGGLAAVQGEVVSLTDAGREYALRIIRSHRLWERFLADETDVKETDWHSEAEKKEHALSDEEVELLAAQLGHPRFDPHGDPIPTGLGNQPATGAVALTEIRPGTPARIVHIEDEPESTYAELVRHGLRPGLTLEVIETSGSESTIDVHGLQITLTQLMAANLTVVPAADREKEEEPHGKTLADIKIGSSARVKRILPGCRGQQRRRLMDLGVLPGTEISADMRSPLGDPVAYSIRGASIALRRDQACMIEIEE
jgi:DtxR family Mn-dependent transcriptional regulator